MTISLDATSVTGYNFSSNTGSGTTGSITTAAANEVIVVVVGHEDHGNAQRTVSTVSNTGTATLTWHKRATSIDMFDSNFSQCEVWWAAAASAGTYTVNVTMTGNVDDASIILFGVEGADTSAPWDTSPVLPQVNGGQNGTAPNTGQPQTAPVNTLNANCMVFTFGGGLGSPQGVFGGSWVQILSQTNGAGALDSATRAYYQVVSSAQAALAVQSTNFTEGGWAQIADAMVAASPSPGTAAVAMDGFASSATASSSTLNNTYITTQGSHDLIFVAVQSDNGSGTGAVSNSVSSITDGASAITNWTQVKKFQFKGATNQNSEAIEIWCGKAAAPLINDQINVTMSASCDGIGVMVWGVNSGISGSYPVVDTNAAAIVTNANGHSGTANSPSWSGLSTNGAVGMLFTIINSTQNGYTVPSGFTQANLGWCNEGSNPDYGQLDCKQFSSAQSSASGTYSGLTDQNWGVVTFAVTQPPLPSGPWASTEGTDTMSFAGGVLGGSWHSTDGTDVFSSTSSPFGPLESTEAKDVMAFHGYPELTGAWASTETKDVYAASAFETPPLALDGSASAGVNGPVSSGTVTLSTTQANDVIVLTVSMGGFFNASLVSTVTDTAGLTWHKRNQRWQSGGNMSTEGAGYGDGLVNQGLDMEIWWAHAPTALTNDVITVTPVAEVGAMALIAFGVSGANYTAPWDTHAQAGGYTDQIGNRAFFPAQSQLHTNANKTFLFGIHGDFTADAGVVQTPWIYTTTAEGSEHDGYTPFESFAYQIVSAPQISTDVPFGFSYAGGFVYASQGVMFDSIVAADEDGTAESTVWFLDPSSVNGIISLTTNNELVLNYSAVNFNLMIVIQVLIQSASGTGEVTSIDESQGLLQSGYHFTRRSRVVEGTLATEIWWGWVPPGNTATGRPNNDTITINTTGTTTGDVISAQMWGIGGTTGSYGLGDPFWDGNSSVPATNQSAGSTPPPNVTGISTETPSCLLVAWTANITEQEPGYVNPFVTLVQDAPATVLPIMQFNSSGPLAYMGFEYFYAPGLATNETAEFLVSPEPVGWMMIGDAIPVGPPQPPTGAWASVEQKDEFTHTGDFSSIGIVGSGGWVGFLPIPGTMATHDHADDFTGTPAQAPYLGEGWLGWVPAHGTMAATDTGAQDRSALAGWVIGTGITGQMRAVESKDREAFSNRPTVTGSWLSTEAKDRMADAGILIPKVPPPTPVKRRLLIIT